MAAEFPFLPEVAPGLAIPGLAAIVYACLITTIALAAVFTSKPARRKAALEVLRLLLPGRRRFPGSDQRPVELPEVPHKREPPSSSSPNP